MLTRNIVLISLLVASNAMPFLDAGYTDGLIHMQHCPTVKELIAGAAIKSLPGNAAFWNDEVPVEVVVPLAKANNRKTIRDVFPELQRDHIIKVCDKAGVDPWDRMSKAYADLASGEAWVIDRPADLKEIGATFSHYDKHWETEHIEMKRLGRVTALYRINLDAENQVVGKYKIEF